MNINERQKQLAGLPINESSLTKLDVLMAIKELRSARSKYDELTRGELVEFLNDDIDSNDHTDHGEVTKMVDKLVKDGKVRYGKKGIELV